MSCDLRTMIADAGGLHTLTAFAKRWGVSRRRASELAAYPTFPAPVLIDPDGRKHYAGHEVEAWRNTQRPAGRPRKD